MRRRHQSPWLLLATALCLAVPPAAPAHPVPSGAHLRTIDVRVRPTELAVHYPLAGSVYNWAKNIARRGTAWMAGVSLAFGVSWLTIIDSVGAGIWNAIAWFRARRSRRHRLGEII